MANDELDKQQDRDRILERAGAAMRAARNATGPVTEDLRMEPRVPRYRPDNCPTCECDRLRALILDACKVFEHYDLPEHAFHYRRALEREPSADQ